MHTKKTESNIKCYQCDYVIDDESNLVKHILSHESCEFCQYCDFVVQDKKDLKEHFHEVMVIMHTMA